MPGSLILLAQARVALGVSLGTVLPEERLASAARWTGQAVEIAAHLDDPVFHALTLRMHGNELRKAGRMGARGSAVVPPEARWCVW
ncbi:hypothetical protein [Nocardia farcinica]|uniref:hypothetical protein n=1 Tax=Nocardia farcinica TaxID=37329 RepID=UPI001E321B25|nr:hypothetical protein [Nocardia farcinica]